MSRALLAVAFVALVPMLSGCTLLKEEEPFQVTVRSELTDPWTGTVRVLDEDGAQVFSRQVTVSRTSIRTPYSIQELDGTHTFAVESGGWRWQDTTSMVPGESGWTVVVRAPGDVCFEYVRGGAAGGSVCPERVAA